MKIVVIGGTGLIGSKLAGRLRLQGHVVTAASPGSGVNTVTGEGLSEVLKDAEVVFDVTNAPSFEDKAVLDFFETSGRNLLAAEAIAAVRHHVVLSVVGTERLQGSAYFRAKMIQENLVRQSGIPYTILHSTQFFEFVGAIARSGMQGDKVIMPSALVQPIASDDVVEALAAIAVQSPVNGMIELAGPEKFHLDQLVKKYLSLTADKHDVVTDVHAPYFGAQLQEHSLLPGKDSLTGMTRYGEWISKPGNLRWIK